MRLPFESGLISALAWTLAICALPLWAAPVVQIEPTRVDFGTVRQGEPVTAELTIGNTGDEMLVVERMEFSVPGLTARLKQKLAPGETAAIRLNWDTLRLRQAVAGRMTLYLNDPATPRVDIDLRGQVVPAIEFQPRPAVYFSQFADERQTDSILLKNNREEPLAIEQISGSSDRFEHRLDTLEPGRAFRISVSTRAGLAAGRYRDHLVIVTDDADYPRLHVEVNILVKPDLFLTPETVDFGTLSRSALAAGSGAADFVRQSVVIRRRHGTMAITALSGDLPALDLSVSPKGQAEGFLLEVGVRPEMLQSGPLEGTVTIETDDPAFPSLAIPIRGTVTD